MSTMVSLGELVNRFEQAHNGSFATVNLLTVPKLRKGCPMALRKRQRATVQLGCSYESVMRKRTGDKDFVAQAIWNGKGQPVNKYVIEHTETKQKYLRLLLTKQIESEFIDETGCVVPKEMVESYLYPSGHDGIVEWLTPKIESVKSVAIGGEELILV